MRRPLRLLLCLPLLLASCEEREGVSVYETTPVVGYAWPETEPGEGSAEGMVWEVPAGWIVTGDVPEALLADYRFEGSTPDLPGRLTVSMIPGDGGGVEANVARWADQLLVATPSDPSSIVTVSPALPHPMGTVWIVQIRGQYAGPTVPSAMLAAVVTIPDRAGRPYATWFLKLTGDSASVQRAGDALTRVIYSLRPEGTPMPELDLPVDTDADPHADVPDAPPLLRRPTEETQ